MSRTKIEFDKQNYQNYKTPQFPPPHPKKNDKLNLHNQKFTFTYQTKMIKSKIKKRNVSSQSKSLKGIEKTQS